MFYIVSNLVGKDTTFWNWKDFGKGGSMRQSNKIVRHFVNFDALIL